MSEEKPQAGRAWSYAWTLWLLAFLGIEITGALTRTGATLSDHVWLWFSLLTHERMWLARRVAFYLFWCVVLTLHFVVGLRAWPWLIVTSAPFGIVIVLAVAFEKEKTT